MIQCPFLTPLLLGRWEDLDIVKQRQIAKWITMFTIVAEYAHPPTISTTQSDCDWFMQNQDAFQDWIIFIGRYQGD